MEYWNDETLRINKERWNFGILEEYSNGNSGMMEEWNNGIIEHWIKKSYGLEGRKCCCAAVMRCCRSRTEPQKSAEEVMS